MGGGVVVLTSDLKVPDTTIDMIRGMGGGVVNVVLTSDLKVPPYTDMSTRKGNFCFIYFV
jgi:hypothetical protein